MGLSDSPHGPASPSRASGCPPALAGRDTLRGLPCCARLPFADMPSPLPRRKNTGSTLVLLRPASLPCVPQVGFRVSIFEACSAFTRVTACRLARPPFAALPSKAPTDSSPPPPLRLLPAGAPVAGRAFHPLKTCAFHGAREIILNWARLFRKIGDARTSLACECGRYERMTTTWLGRPVMREVAGICVSGASTAYSMREPAPMRALGMTIA